MRLVLAGGERPHAAWARLPAGAFEALLLGPLIRQESAELLRSVGVGAAAVPSITRFAGGHVLTLLLAVLAVKEQPALPVQDVTLGRLIMAPDPSPARVDAPAGRAAARLEVGAVALHGGHDLPAGESRGQGGALPLSGQVAGSSYGSRSRRPVRRTSAGGLILRRLCRCHLEHERPYLGDDAVDLLDRVLEPLLTGRLGHQLHGPLKIQSHRKH